jgi:hypothetical protein
LRGAAARSIQLAPAKPRVAAKQIRNTINRPGKRFGAVGNFHLSRSRSITASGTFYGAPDSAKKAIGRSFNVDDADAAAVIVKQSYALAADMPAQVRGIPDKRLFCLQTIPRDFSPGSARVPADRRQRPPCLNASKLITSTVAFLRIQ